MIRKSTRRAIVGGGGGLAGIAWQTGYLAGLSSAGINILDIDLFLGTSGGATVAAQVMSGIPIEDLYERQTNPTLQTQEKFTPFNMESFAFSVKSRIEHENPQEARRQLGLAALRAQTITESERRKIVANRLPSHEWPQAPIAITAIDALTGKVEVFNNKSGIDLVDAVAASTAIPGVWPPATINGRRYIDGGVRTMENADLAVGCDLILVLQALVIPNVDSLTAEVELLRNHGAEVFVARPDDTSLLAMGPNPLDPNIRAATAEAGYAQARYEADAVRRLFTG